MKTLSEKLNQYGLSEQVIIDLMAYVQAQSGAWKLPAAIADSFQEVCNEFNVRLIFKDYRNQLILVGIENYNRSSYLYPDNKLNDSQRIIKSKGDRLHLIPEGNNTLFLESELT